jgi:hypothetical protein
MISRARRSVCLVAIIAAGAVASGGCMAKGNVLQPLPAGGHHVLFIGNSLTYTNDLPGTVAQLAVSVGDTILTGAITGPDFALIDHLNAGTAVAAIAQGGWEYVVLQQGPSTVDVSRDSLVLWTKMFDPYVRATGARTALLMVWPDVTRTSFFDACRVSYQTAASAVDGVFMPAGEAWVAAWAMDPTLALYASDGLHPSPLGTYLAALVIFERVTGRDSRTLPSQAVVAGHPLAVSAQTVRLLQQAAHQADTMYPAR